MRLIIETDNLAQARIIFKDLHFDDVRLCRKEAKGRSSELKTC